ncbi:MAG: tetratricopeptide repeat protein [Candidatus Zixiibacteriota bacterium]|nr:MAG: tetratricopeptide repeat protein [candidate division Zixibacteria bacterium]
MPASADIVDRINKCQKILDQDPNSQIFAALAEGHRKNGDLDKAFKTCQNGLRIHPTYGSAHIVMAKINLDRGLFDWAEAEVQRAIEIDGTSRAIELLLAEIYIYKGEFNTAIKLLKRLYESDPGNTQIKKLLSIAQKLPEEQAAMTGQVPDKPPAPTEVAPSETPGEPAPKSFDVLSTVDVVQQAMSLPELKGAQFVNPEGLIVDSEWALEMNATTCAATLSDLGRILSKELVESSFGKSASILIENTEHVFYLIHVENGMFLFVGNSAANLGGLRMRIGSLIERYRAGQESV